MVLGVEVLRIGFSRDGGVKWGKENPEEVKGPQDMGKGNKWENPSVKSHSSASQCYLGPGGVPIQLSTCLTGCPPWPQEHEDETGGVPAHMCQ